MSVEQLRAMPVIEVQIAICKSHWDLYVVKQPRRVMPVFLLKMFDQLMGDEPFAKACKTWRDGAAWELPSDFSVVNYHMRSEPFRPWCSYLGEERLEAAWSETPYKIVGES